MYPPATEPVSMAAPLTTCPRPKTDSRLPSNPVAFSASTSQASTAPEKNVKPRPSSTETTAHAQNGASICHSRTYSSVVAASVTVPSRYDTRRPIVSATIPVGTSKMTMPDGEEGVGRERLEVREPGVEQEDRVDPPDERRRQRVAEQEQ